MRQHRLYAHSATALDSESARVFSDLLLKVSSVMAKTDWQQLRTHSRGHAREAMAAG